MYSSRIVHGVVCMCRLRLFESRTKNGIKGDEERDRERENGKRRLKKLLRLRACRSNSVLVPRSCCDEGAFRARVFACVCACICASGERVSVYHMCICM